MPPQAQCGVLVGSVSAFSSNRNRSLASILSTLGRTCCIDYGKRHAPGAQKSICVALEWLRHGGAARNSSRSAPSGCSDCSASSEFSGYWRAVDYVRRGRVLIVRQTIPRSSKRSSFLSCSFPGRCSGSGCFRGVCRTRTSSRVSRRSIMSGCAAFELGRDDTLESRKLNWSAMKRVMEHFERQQCFVATSKAVDEQASRTGVGRTEQDGQDQECPDPQGRLEKGRLDYAAARQDDGRHEAGSAGIRKSSGACSSVRNAGRSGSSFAIPTRSSDRGSTKKRKRDVWNWQFSRPRYRQICRPLKSAIRAEGHQPPPRRFQRTTIPAVPRLP